MTTRLKDQRTRFAAKPPRGNGVPAAAVPAQHGSPAGIHPGGGRALSREEAKTAKALAGVAMPADVQLPFAGQLHDLAPAGLPGPARVRIAFDGPQTIFDWGPWLDKVNQNPYQYYLRQAQPATQIDTHGIDPAVATSPSTRWGRVVLSVNEVQYSSRFGGSLHVRLSPCEDFGIELVSDGAGASRIYVNLNKWLLHLWIQPTRQLFNTPWAPVQDRVYTELEATDYETYELAGSRFVPHSSATPEAVGALFAAAAAEAQARLQKVSQFALGYVHEKELPGFDYQGEAVEDILLSDGMCAFRTRSKTPHVQVKMNTHYLGTASTDGVFDDDAEVTAEPWVILRDPTYVVSSVEKQKYIGSGSSTGFLTFDYLTLEEAARVKKLSAFASWTEDDPLSDDYGSSNGFAFDVSFDKAQLQADAAANNLGQIGTTLFGLQHDPLEDWLSYAVEIEFDLVKL